MQKKREYSLDVLKCIGVITIIFHHYQQITGAYFEKGINFWNGNFNWAYFVELFFILSGYFTYKNIENINENSEFIKFFKKKYFRFFPILLASGIGCLIAEFMLFVVAIKQPLPYTMWDIVTGLTGTHYWIESLGTSTMLNYAMWYISVLFLCYIIFFYTTYIARRWKISPFVLYVAVLCIGNSMRIIGYVYTITLPFFTTEIGRGYSCFFWGLLLRYILEKYPIHRKPVTFVTGVAWIAFMVYLYVYKKHYFGDEWYTLCFLIYPVVIIVFKSGLMCKIFSSEKLKYLGGISFNAFAWHVPVLRIVFVVAYWMSWNLNSLKAMLMTTGVIFAIGACSHFFIEKPIERKVNVWLKEK